MTIKRLIEQRHAHINDSLEPACIMALSKSLFLRKRQMVRMRLGSRSLRSTDALSVRATQAERDETWREENAANLVKALSCACECIGTGEIDSAGDEASGRSVERRPANTTPP